MPASRGLLGGYGGLPLDSATAIPPVGVRERVSTGYAPPKNPEAPRKTDGSGEGFATPTTSVRPWIDAVLTIGAGCPAARTAEAPKRIEPNEIANLICRMTPSPR